MKLTKENKNKIKEIVLLDSEITNTAVKKVIEEKYYKLLQDKEDLYNMRSKVFELEKLIAYQESYFKKREGVLFKIIFETEEFNHEIYDGLEVLIINPTDGRNL